MIQKGTSNTRIYLAALTLMLLFSNCTEEQTRVRKYDLFDRRGSASTELRAIKIASDSLNLLDLSSGPETFALRVWFDYDDSDTGQIFTLVQIKSNWHAEMLTFVNSYNKERTAMYSRTLSRNHVFPKNGFEDVFKHLNELGIFTIPDSRSIKNYPNPLDGAKHLTFEVANDSVYRLFGYGMPFATGYRIKEIDDVRAIILFLCDQFQITLRASFDDHPLRIQFAPVLLSR